MIKTFILPHLNYGATWYYSCVNDKKTEKSALTGLEKIDTCVKNIIKKAYDIPPNLSNMIANKMLGKYAFTEKIKYSTIKIIAR